MPFERARHVASRSLRLVALLCFWYVSCFFLMMEWGCPAFDPDSGDRTNESYYRMVGRVRIDEQYTIMGAPTCWANRVFVPFDWYMRSAKDAMGCRTFPEVFPSRVVRVIHPLSFWLTLFMPFWYPLCFMSRESRRMLHVRPLLSLVPAVSYFALICVYHFIRLDYVPQLVGQSVTVFGTFGAMIAIIWAGRGRWCILVVPLLVAMLSGTCWIVFFDREFCY
jgi:hypothetical protein